MSTIALNKLWEYIQLLSLSNENKDWLVGKIIESKSDCTDTDAIREKKLYSMFGAWADDPDIDNIESAIREGRQTGVTRNIVSFDDL